MKVKRGANIQGLQLPMRAVLRIYETLWEAHGFPPCVTSGLDGEHMGGSLHAHGLAVDLRTWRNKYGQQMGQETKSEMVAMLRMSLADVSPRYQVVVRKSHIHVEYDDGRFGRGWSEVA